MRKLLSVLLAVVMVVSIGISSTMVAMAAPVASIESTTKKKPNVAGDVNGQTSTDVRYEVDPADPNKITFTYDGDGELVGWKFLPETLREGVDYKITNQSGKSITVELLNGYSGDVVANAIVNYPEQPTVPGEEPEEPDEEPDEEEETTGKKNPGHKSPNTGVASATGLGVAAAGAAILVALKKKDDAE